MSAPVWDDKALLEVYQWRKEGRTWAWISAQGNEEGDAAKVRFSKARSSGRLARVLEGGPETAPESASEMAGERMEWTETNGKADLWSRSPRIKTLEALLEAAEVDLTRWYVKTHKIKKYDFGAKGPDGSILAEDFWSITATLWAVPNAALIHSVTDAAIAAMDAHSPEYRPVKYPPPGATSYMFEPVLADPHLGMLAWGEETGGADWDSEITERVIDRAVDDMISRVSGYSFDKVVFPILGDFFHADATIGGSGGQTNKGTSLDVDSRLEKMFQVGQRILVRSIDRFRLMAPVEVPIIPGNHDWERLRLLGYVLEAFYRNDEHVTIRNDPRPRKYTEWGATLLGLSHGHLEKTADLPGIMAREEPQAWARTSTRVWHRAHTHAKEESLKESAGVRVAVIPSLAPEDAWHAERGYGHVRCTECYLWEYTEGFAGMFSVNARQDARAAA